MTHSKTGKVFYIMNICVFDTETTSLDKPFCYNIGYCIANTETQEILVKKDFVVEQIWHNLPLFSSAYYADKRPIYVKALKSRKMIMKKYGYITQEMARDFEKFDIENAYAFNCGFDETVFDFNCEWFKCINPFDNIKVFDIRATAIKFLVNDEYKKFCEQNGLFTESGNYSTTAESFFKFLTRDTEFIESHTALADSEIETAILFECTTDECELTEKHTCPRSIPRVTEKNLIVKQDGEIVLDTTYTTMRFYKDKGIINLK